MVCYKNIELDLGLTTNRQKYTGRLRVRRVFALAIVFFSHLTCWGNFVFCRFGRIRNLEQLEFRLKHPTTKKKCNCKKFRLLSYLGFWEIKDWSFSGLFISSFFSPLFCCFTLKTPILSLKKKFLMGMPGGHLLHTRLCFRLVKLDASVWNVTLALGKITSISVNISDVS